MTKRRFIPLLAVAVSVTIVVLSIPWGKRKSDAINCGNCMIAIGFATRVWSDDHDGHLPSNFLCMSNELSTPKLLICPADTSRTAPTNWTDFAASQLSYEMLKLGPSTNGSPAPFIRCKIHGFICYTDGSVFDGTKRLKKWPAR